jgi:RNA polymerase sigma-70 factor, ECF subfamily
MSQIRVAGDAATFARNEASFEAVISPLVESALRLAYSMLGDRWEAEDAVQESIAKAWRKLHQLRSGSLARPWFLAIVANQCRNMRRTRWFGLQRTAETPSTAAEPDLERLDLERAIDKLSATDRQAIFLFFYLDLPLDEVAAVLGISPSAARGRVYRACRRLRPDLEEATF